uniref:YqaJ viral recombinase domain-containing protein n=1 Tax=Schizaphis graminum TaxID=13262 RepID=A0A2S2P0I0_SCHGA
MIVDDLNSAIENDDVKLEKYIANCILNKSVQSVVLLQLFSYTENLNEIKSCCRNTYNSLFVCDIEEVYFKSKINRSNWNEERKYRITGSRCYSIYTYRGTDWKKKATNYFNSKKINNDYTCHGENEEGNARYAYISKTGAIVEETGIIVSNSNPWLSYSPDGVIMDNHVPKKLLEIKCPYLGIL